jgi:uncharacterized membrane protein YphA (DoxX/SURF4 family)
MLNTFPGLLLPFLAPTLLRVAVAIVFFYIAYQQWSKREAIATTPYPKQILQGPAVAWLAIVTGIAIGLSLLFGYYTQVAALAGFALSLPVIFWKHDPNMFPLSRSTWALLCVVCLSLILSGAGAYAQDLPL